MKNLPFKSLIIRHVTLLEILIALMLTTFVLITLTYFYQDVVSIGIEVDKTRHEEFYMRYVENRLLNTVSRSVGKKSSDFVFFSINDESVTKLGSQSLIFMFDNGFNLDKDFSNHVLGRLFLNENGNLMLVSWPSPKYWDMTQGTLPVKKEILLQNVTSLAFEFFVAPEQPSTEDNGKTNSASKKKPVQDKNENNDQDQSKDSDLHGVQGPEPKGDWTKRLWSQDFKQLPVLIKVILTKTKNAPQGKTSEEKLVFVFPLVSSDAHILYD